MSNWIADDDDDDNDDNDGDDDDDNDDDDVENGRGIWVAGSQGNGGSTGEGRLI